MPSHILTLLATVCLLFGSASADIACQDMPCCAGDRVAELAASELCEVASTNLKSSVSAMSCGEKMSAGCNCLLTSGQPIESQENAVIFSFRFETVSREIRPVVLPEELVEIVVEKSTWQDHRELPEILEHVSFSAFPNPPPAAA